MASGGWARVHRLSVIAIVCVVVLVSAVGAWLVERSLTVGPGPAPPIRDGSTFYEVLSDLQDSMANVSGGPWALFSVYGIAAPVPFSPNLIGYGDTNVTVNSCGQAFNGLTLWNGTIPLFNGTFDSGTAPFWQLAYFSSSSQEILVATDVLGNIHVFPAIPYPSSCMPWYDFPGNAANWTSPSEFPAVDSSLAAQVAWNSDLPGSRTVGQQIARDGPTVEIITAGPGIFMGLGDTVSAYGIWFDRCGEQGVAGVQPLIGVGVGRNGTWLGSSNLTHNCVLLKSGPPGYSGGYDLLFSPASTNVASTTKFATVGFQVGDAYPNGTFAGFYDEVGLANWMTSWNLTNVSGAYLPEAIPTCQAWVPTIADCVANSSGWFAVVLSAGGGWVNCYGALPGGGTGWSEPVTALVSHQQLVIVCPSSWNVTGDVLNVASTVSTSTVAGSLTL
jgi:hypothetical protein